MEYIHLLDQFTDGFEHVLILTYSHDLAFYEQMLHAKLRGGGARNLILLVDAGEHERTFSQPLQEAGLSYVVQPISVAGAFHPKLILLTGPDRGRLLVGSGNLTVPGYARNREVFAKWDYRTDSSDEASLSVFRQAMGFISNLQTRYPFRSSVQSRLSRLMEETPWLGGIPDIQGAPLLLHNLNEPLLDQLERLTGSQQASRIVAMSPYFDHRCLAVQELLHRWRPQELQIITARTPRLDPAALARVLGSASVSATVSVPVQNDREPDRYPHAKWLLIEGESQSLLVMGSANLTAPALLQTAATGNVECLVAFTDTTAERFKTMVLAPLVLETVNPADLACLDVGEPALSSGSSLHLTDATVSGGRLLCCVSNSDPSDPPTTVDIGGDSRTLVPHGDGCWSAAFVPRSGRSALPVRVMSAVRESNAVWLHHQEKLDDALMSQGERADRELVRRFAADPNSELLNVLMALERNMVFQRADLSGVSQSRPVRETTAREGNFDGAFEDYVDAEADAFPEAQRYGAGSGSLISEVMGAILGMLRQPDLAGSAARSGTIGEAVVSAEVRAEVAVSVADDKEAVRRRMERFVRRFVAGMSESEFLQQLPPQVHLTNYSLLEKLNLLAWRLDVWGLPQWAAVSTSLMEVFLPAMAEVNSTAPGRIDSMRTEAICTAAARIWHMLGRLNQLAESVSEMEQWRELILANLTELGRQVPLESLGDEPAFADALETLREGRTSREVALGLDEACPEHDEAGLLRKVRRLLKQEPDLRVEADRVTLIYETPLEKNRRPELLTPLLVLGKLICTRPFRHIGMFVVYVRNHGGTSPQRGLVMAVCPMKRLLIRIYVLKTGNFMVDRRERFYKDYFLTELRRANTLELTRDLNFVGAVGRQEERTPAAELVRLCGLSSID